MHLSLFGEFVNFLQTRTGDTPFENAIVLFGIHVEGFFVHRGVILDLIHGRVRFSRLLRQGLGLGLRSGLGKVVLEEEVGGMRDRRGGRGRAW